MDFETRKEAFLAGLNTEPFFSMVQMTATIEAALAKHLGNLTMFRQLPVCLFDIPTEVQRSYAGGCRHFGIANPALQIFCMMEYFHPFITKAKYCNNLGVHAILRFRFGFSTINFTRFRMDFAML
jgi:hypothetical protein